MPQPSPTAPSDPVHRPSPVPESLARPPRHPLSAPAATATCRYCHQPVCDDDLWGWIHTTGHYMCEGPEGWPGDTRATPGR